MPNKRLQRREKRTSRSSVSIGEYGSALLQSIEESNELDIAAHVDELARQFLKGAGVDGCACQTKEVEAIFKLVTTALVDSTLALVDRTLAQQHARVYAARAIHHSCGVSMNLLSVALSHAVASGHLPLVRLFVEELAMLRRIPGLSRRLLFSSIDLERVDLVEYLLKSGVSPEGLSAAACSDSMQPLTAACPVPAMGMSRICHLLLSAGAALSDVPASERQRMFHGITRHVLWPALRGHVTMRGVAFYWMGLAAEAACAAGGAGRQHDLDAFQCDPLLMPEEPPPLLVTASSSLPLPMSPPTLLLATPSLRAPGLPLTRPSSATLACDDAGGAPSWLHRVNASGRAMSSANDMAAAAGVEVTAQSSIEWLRQCVRLERASFAPEERTLKDEGYGSNGILLCAADTQHPRTCVGFAVLRRPKRMPKGATSRNWFAALDMGNGGDGGDEDFTLGQPYTEVQSALLVKLAVAPSHQRRGVGKAIVAAAIGQARAMRAGRVTLHVDESNVPACALYRSVGFVQRGMRLIDYYSAERHAIEMVVDVQ